MLKCKDIPAHAERLLDGDLRPMEKASLRLHLLMCAHCRRYTRQLRTLVGALPNATETANEADIQRVLARLEQLDRG